MRKITTFHFFVILCSASIASAANPTANATLTVSGTLASSLQLTVTNAPGSTSALNTAASTTALGTFSYYAPPTGFSATNDGSGAWHLSSSSGSHPAVQAILFNAISLSYSLAAYISGAAPPIGVTWKLNGVTLPTTSASPAVLNAAALYATNVSLPWEIDFSALAVPGSIGSQITFVATAN